MSRRHQLERGMGRHPGREVLGVFQGASDDLPIPSAARRAQGAPDGEGAKAAGIIRHVFERVPRTRLVIQVQIGRARAERIAQISCIAHEDEPAVVRNVQPLVAIGCDRSSLLDAVEHMLVVGRERRVETKRSIDVQPGPARMRRAALRHAADGIERAGVHLARGGDDDDRPVDGGQCSVEAGEVDRAVAGGNGTESPRPSPSMPRALTSL